MIKAVLLNRLTDGLIYCQTTDGYNDEKISNIKGEIKKFHKQVTAYSKDPNSPLKQIQNSQFGIHYKVDSYVIFTVISEKGYSAKLVSSFIDTISRCFFDEAKCILGAQNLRSRLQAIQGTHFFAKHKFDRIIKKKQAQYDDPTTPKNTDRLKKELQNIQQIIRVSMTDLQDRHKDLLSAQQKAIKIKEESKKFHDGTKKLVWQLWIKKNLIWLVLALFVVVLYFVVF